MQIRTLTTGSANLTAELQDLRDRLAKFDSPEGIELRAKALSAADWERSSTLARNYAVELQEKIDRLVKESNDAEKRLFELWQAATMATELKIRGNIAGNAMGRLRKALEETAIDCGQIPF